MCVSGEGRVCVCVRVCVSSQMSLNRTPSALRIPAATGEHLTSSRLLLERCQIKGVCVCVGLRKCVCVPVLECVCFRGSIQRPVKLKVPNKLCVTQTGQVPCMMAVAGLGLLCLCLFVGEYLCVCVCVCVCVKDKERLRFYGMHLFLHASFTRLQ